MSSSGRAKRGLPTSLWTSGWLALGACAFLPVEGGLGDCSGALLASVESSGAVCLERMVQNGGNVAQWLEQEGKPDYFEASGSRVRLLYIDRDQVLELSRTATGSIGAKTSTPIRASDHMRFRDADKVRLGQARIARVPRAPAAVEEEANEVRPARVGERVRDPRQPEAEAGVPEAGEP